MKMSFGKFPANLSDNQFYLNLTSIKHRTRVSIFPSILTQAEELTQANEEISRMNQSLEVQVLQPAAEVKWQNEKLIEYAYFNAHNVRGPLARILGLSILMSMEKSLGELQEYNSLMYSSAQELDKVIREINFKLTDSDQPFPG